MHQVPVVELVVEPIRNMDRPVGVAILDDDEVVRLEKGPPLLQEIQAANGWNNYVQLIRKSHGATREKVVIAEQPDTGDHPNCGLYS